MAKQHVQSGDNVKVLAGKDKGKTGKILQVFPKKNRVVVEGINVMKKHLKSRGNEKGQVIELSAPVHISNVKKITESEKETKK
ncbi:MAG: 50S ribosomal protein L24 [Parcubacteria group bacterium]|nr:50S ribosomal protein L24 [Parcubacteria group bacterium]|tara:strand:+ start:369 stop:617 length:249 start_codon:yes stop_codon:yes gene_type:complete